MVTYGTTTEVNREEIIPLTTGDYVVNHVEQHDQIDQKFAINPDRLKILNEKLGSGHYGDVYLGLLLESDGKQVTVAVKKSKILSDVGLSREQRAERFLQQLNSLRCELHIMSFIGSHPNVLELKGAITNRNDFCVVTEYCEYGSLDSFLREKDNHGKFLSDYVIKSNDGYQLTISEFHWKNQSDQSWETDFDFRRKEGIVTTSDLLWFGWQIAQGMEFLTKNIVHRDIALRNMLLTDGYIVKIADFGLSRKIVNGMYQPTSQPDMPIGYLAPEVLQDNQFSKESESWAFAILLWEMFMLASRQPYCLELGPGPVDKAAINAYLEGGNRLPLPEIAPYSIRRLIGLLWSREPADRPDFKKSQTMIIDDLKTANPKLAAIAQEMSNQNCGNSSSDSIDSSVPPYKIIDKQQLIIADKINPKRISKLVKENSLVLSVTLILTVALFTILSFTWLTSTTDKSKPQGVGDRFVSARWSWSFNASDVFNAKLEHKFYGTQGELDLGPDCGVLKWRPFLIRMQKNETLTEFPFFLEYSTGPENVPIRAWRSMVLITDDGREIMQGNDFLRNGFVYSKGSSDNSVWAAKSTYLTNTSDNDPLTLKIEVFVNLNWVGCKAVKMLSQTTSTNYEEECNRLSTNTKLYFNGSCYVGSNTKTQFKYAIKICNDIPSAAISRLAWIESEQLLEKLREVLVIHTRYGTQVNKPYFIGAKQSLEKNDIRSAPGKNWYWIDSDENWKKPFPSNFSLWTHGEPNDNLNADEQYAAVFYEQQNVSDVVDSNRFRYLCEYKSMD